MRRTTRQKMRVRLTAAQGDYDPLTHYWYKAGKNDYRRVCDDEPWLSGLRWKVPPEALTCGPCRDLYLCDQVGSGDHRGGPRAFALTKMLLRDAIRWVEGNIQQTEIECGFLIERWAKTGLPEGGRDDPSYRHSVS